MSLPEDSGVWTNVLCRMQLCWAWICWSTLGSGTRAAPKVKDSTGVVEDPARVVEVSLTMSNLAFFGRLFFGRWCCTFGRVACLSMLLLTWWKHTDVPVNYREHQPGVSLIFFLSQVTQRLWSIYGSCSASLPLFEHGVSVARNSFIALERAYHLLCTSSLTPPSGFFRHGM